jgi:hypothetical protein
MFSGVIHGKQYDNAEVSGAFDKSRKAFLRTIFENLSTANRNGGTGEAIQLACFIKESADSGRHHSAIKYKALAAGTVDGLSLVAFLKRGVPIVYAKLGTLGKEYIRIHWASTLHLPPSEDLTETEQEERKLQRARFEEEIARAAAARAEAQAAEKRRATAAAKQKLLAREEEAARMRAAAAAEARARNQARDAGRAVRAASRGRAGAGGGGGGGGGLSPRYRSRSRERARPESPPRGLGSKYERSRKSQSGGVRWKKTERKARKYRNKTYKQKGGANILSINLILALINVLFEYSFSVARGVPGLPQECSLFRLPFVSIDPADRTDYADLTLRVQAENGEYIFVDNPLLGLPLASILYLLQEKLDDELESDYAEFIIEDFLTGFNFTESEIRILKPEILRLSNNPGSVAASSLASAPSSPPTSVSPFTRPIANIDIEQFYTMVQEYGAVIPGFKEEEGGDTPAPAATVAKEAMESGGGGGGGGPSTLEPLDPFHTPPLSTGETNLRGQLPRDLLLLKLKEAAAAAGGGGMQQNLLPIQVKLAQGAARGTSVAGMGHRRGQKGGYRYKKTFKHGKSRKRTTYRKRL